MAEVNPIPEIIESKGLVVDSAGVWREIPYVWADQQYGDPPKAFAKYLFTYTNAAQWHLWDEWGDGFVSEVIEPVYFQLANDISWNIYWVSVLNETELCQIDTQQRISFSSNTEYTRNLLIPLENLANSIPIGRIATDTIDGEMTLPSDVWMAQLDAEGLDFCLSEYATKNLDAYLEGRNRKQKTAAPSVEEFKGQRLTKLESIFVPKSFRAHCYPKDWTIPFRNVNLLYGLNGSGKTSLLSAIELAMTGQVRSLMEEVEQSTSTQEATVLTVETDQETIDLHPPQTSMRKKERERKFYKSRSAKRLGSQLQSLFHRFNYLSADEAFLFARQQPDFSSIFSQILYGPETQEMWRSLGHYKSECASRAAKYENEIKVLNDQINALPEVPPADEASFRTYLAASGLQFNLEASPMEILMEAQKILTEYDKVRNLVPIPSQSQLSKAQVEQAEQCRTLSEETDSLAETMKQAKELVSNLGQETEEWEKRLQSVKQMVSSIEELEPLAKQMQFRVDHEEWFIKYQTRLTQQLSCQNAAIQLSHYLESYETVLAAPPTATFQQLREQARLLQGKKDNLQKQLKILQPQIDQQELVQEKRIRLFSELSTTGLEIYQLEEQRHVCPLCGADGITEAVLRKHLEEESAQGDQQLQELYRERLDLTSAVKNIDSELKNINQQEIIAQDYRDALSSIQQKFPDIHSAAELRQAYEDAQENQSALKKEIAEIERYFLEELKKTDITGTIKEICESRQNLLNLISPAYATLNPDTSDWKLITTFSTLLLNRKKQMVECEERLSQKQDALKQQQKAVEQFQRTLEQNHAQLKQLKKESLRLNQISVFWKAVGLVTADSMLSGEAVQNLCQRIHSLASNIIKSIQSKQKKESLLKAIATLQEKLNRCYVLQGALEKLLPPENYADAFICQNVAQISRIFLALHSPQEFSGLDIENNQLIAFRNKERVPINRMSTGQRTALVIAVFFQMNLATPSVPSFLLLDEPVANIDDLNVLALIDFLREIAVTHKRQIFFTTANRNVAKLFRRKFSFLLDDFQELRFFREKEHSLQIVMRSYNQSRLLESTKL